MKLDEAREHYYQHSGSASSAARQLAFAGIAVVWILATEGLVVTIPAGALRAPLLAFVITLGLDLIQYYWLAAFWGIFARRKEKRREAEFTGVPPWANWIGIGCWTLKGVMVAVGYYWLSMLLWPVLFRV